MAASNQAAQAGAFSQGRRIVLEGGIQGLISTVYFEADTAILIEASRPTLEVVGQYLSANPSSRLLVRSYTAPFGTPGGRDMVSEARTAFCREYYLRNYGIAASRITSEDYASKKEPELITTIWESYRCAELIIIAQ
jgi:outer membrane protein OmpA-like peptidoglycan-associated protein